MAQVERRRLDHARSGKSRPMDITDRVVVITGASSGIGEATARLAHARSARVVLAARRADRLAALADELQAVLPAMRSQGEGAIVNISSGTSRRVIPGVGAYAATKAALNMLSAVAREEFAHDGVVVSSVLPTYTTSEFHGVLQAGAGPSRDPVDADTVEHVAEEILRAVETGEPEIVLPPKIPVGGR
jgi:short-subunit dehydrogenase